MKLLATALLAVTLSAAGSVLAPPLALAGSPAPSTPPQSGETASRAPSKNVIGRAVDRWRDNRATRKEFKEYVKANPELDQFHHDAMHAEHVGRQRAVAAGTAVVGVGGVVAAAVAAPIVLPVAAAAGAVVVTRSVRYATKAQKNEQDANGATLEEAQRLSKDDSSLKVKPGTIQRMLRAAVIRSNAVRKVRGLEEKNSKTGDNESKGDQESKKDKGHKGGHHDKESTAHHAPEPSTVVE
jgi:hypothetical protein